MATLLNAVNEILLRVNLIAGDSSALTTLDDSARQAAIDIAIQVVNEGIDELYSTTGKALPNEQAEGLLTLVTGTRDYTLDATLVAIRWPFIDKTNNQYLSEYPGGYNQMLLDDPEQDDTGLPHFAAIRPTDSKLYLDRAPTSVENGRIYTYQFDKDLALTLASDAMPFKDVTFRAMVPAWVQLWKREKRNEFDGELFIANMGRAARTMTQGQPRTDYSPR